MEFNFNVASYIGAPVGHEGPFVGRIDEDMLRERGRGQDLCAVLEVLGKNSAIAQGLRKPVTLGHPYLCGQRIYLLADGHVALGLIKVGTKKLYVAPPPVAQRKGRSGSVVQDALQEINPVCALDFYVHESCQRHGYGKLIFDTMLREERLIPAELAYDRPSPKLIGFLAKHFHLTEYRPQNNNFVVFDAYFQAGPPEQSLEPKGGLGRHTTPLQLNSGTSAPYGSDQSQHLLPQTQQFHQQPQPFGRVQAPWEQAGYGMPPRAPGSRASPSFAAAGPSPAATPGFAATGPGPPTAASGSGQPPAGFNTRMATGQSRSSQQSHWSSAADSSAAAGMPSSGASRSGNRSMSVPSGGRRHASAPPFGVDGGPGPPGPERYGTGSSKQRFCSPLSHAGSLLLG
eukprot:TRINITY_DN109683_c0_g1_i1.p1 TRINITY_DN109683_c0_g1~~TRINITY_DN109683_c0_g1_i1.p1  ORF type:complete len:400 (-),score=49.81 TRINITY_DN109683_c0_g1_i1:32-1231(-)